jgi:peptidoglycan/xylan/chitin deacetylase (PgdA/CDA1 family)
MLGRLSKLADLALARVLAARGGAGADTLLVFAFHAVLEETGELDAGVLDPYQPVTLADIEALVGALRGRGFRFVTGREIAGGRVRGPAAWLTFDDGYANNLRLLPLLQRLDVPATVFVASGFVERGEAYWWDVLYREGRRLGRPQDALAARREALKALPPDRIRDEIAAEFGEAALRPDGDLDRPMTPEELAAFAGDPRVEIGNHTHRHAILPVLDAAAQRAEITRCQEALAAITGRQPVSIAYPNGDATPETLDAAAAAGLEVGVTCLPCAAGLDALGAGGRERLAIGRFTSLRHGRIGTGIALATAPLSLGKARARRATDRLHHA